MSKPQKRCVFCGGTPATKGHIWPEWLERYLPPSAGHHQETVGEILTFELKAEGPTPRIISRQGNAGSRKPRNTCVKCNGGWMSRIEQCNIEKLSDLIMSRRTVLTPLDQWLLSSLLCLITIRLEFTDRQMQGVPVHERTALMETGHPPFDTWRIWLARYGGESPGDHWSRHFGMQVVASPDQMFRPPKCNTQVTTMVIGGLCIHLISSSVMPIPRGYEGVALARIWPPIPRDIDSGFFEILDDEEVVHLHESFAASLKPA